MWIMSPEKLVIKTIEVDRWDSFLPLFGLVTPLSSGPATLTTPDETLTRKSGEELSRRRNAGTASSGSSGERWANKR